MLGAGEGHAALVAASLVVEVESVRGDESSHGVGPEILREGHFSADGEIALGVWGRADLVGVVSELEEAPASAIAEIPKFRGVGVLRDEAPQRAVMPVDFASPMAFPGPGREGRGLVGFDG